MSLDYQYGCQNVLSNVTAVVVGHVGEALNTFRCVTYSKQLNNAILSWLLLLAALQFTYTTLVNKFTCPFVVYCVILIV